MRIGIITDVIDDKGAGIGTYVRNLVEKLVEEDKQHEYYLIHHKKNNDPLYSGKNEIIIPIPKIPLGRELRKIIIMPKKLEKYNLDIVHETAQLGPFFFKTKFKKIVTICDIAPLIVPESQTLRRIIHHKLALGITLRNVDKIITISNSTKEDILKTFKVNEQKIKTTHLAAKKIFKPTDRDLSRELLKNKYTLNKKYFLFVSTVEPRKNIKRIIQAFNLFNKDNNYKLVLIGKLGWKYEDILKYIENPDIVHLSKIKTEELVHFYNCSEALVYPSLYEGFGLPILEAMQCKCPVITSKSSAMQEVAKNAAILIDPKNTQEIFNAMNEVKNEEIKSRLITKGMERSKDFSWNRCAKETMEIYNNLK